MDIQETPLKFNSLPLKIGNPQRETHLPTIIFQGQTVKSQGFNGLCGGSFRKTNSEIWAHCPGTTLCKIRWWFDENASSTFAKVIHKGWRSRSPEQWKKKTGPMVVWVFSGDYTTHYMWEIIINHYKGSLLTNQESKSLFFFSWLNRCCPNMWSQHKPRNCLSTDSWDSRLDTENWYSMQYALGVAPLLVTEANEGW